MRTTRATASLAPVLALLDMSASEFKAARRESGLGEVLETAGVTREAFRDARREGRQAAREAVRELCASGADAETDDSAG